VFQALKNFFRNEESGVSHQFS
ncbi:hypothetical protein, partial [Bacillus subtilis]